MGEICWQALCTTSIFSLACAAIPLTVHLLPCYQYYEAEVQLRRIHLLRLSEKPWRSLHRSTPGRLRGVFRPISPALHQPYSPPEYCLYPFSDSLSAGLWPLGCVAKRIGQPFHEDPWDFYHVGLCRRPVKSLFLGPQLLSHQRQSVGEGRTALVVPGRWANGVHVLIISHLVVSQEGDHGEQAQQRRGGPSERLLRPVPLGFEAQALTHLLKSSLQLPSPDKVRDDPLGICIELGA